MWLRAVLRQLKLQIIMIKMNRIRFAVAGSSVVAVACALSLANAQIPDSFKGKFPKPKSQTTRWSFLADMDANIPIVILVNRTGATLTNYTQLDVYVDDELGVMSHGRGGLPNGQQRIIAPYIRSGGTVRMVYQISGRRPRSWSSNVPLRAGVPLILTFYPNDRVTANSPYKQLQ